MGAERILAAANGSLGATLLEVLEQAGAPLAGVLVGPARTGHPEPCPFTLAWARGRGLPTVHVRSWRDPDAIGALDGLEFDLLLSLAYDLILPQSVLDRAGRAVNLHRGLAPAFRGCYSTAWSLELGADAVGVTLHEMTAAVDAGAILAQRSIEAAPELTAAELTPAVEGLAVELLADSIGPLLAGELSSRAQHGGRSFPHQLPPHDLNAAGEPELANRVRALHFPPHPPVGLMVGERRFAIVEAAPESVTKRLAGATWSLEFSSAAGALAHLLAQSGGPLVLPFCGSHSLLRAARASGRPLRFYALGDDLRPELGSLRTALSPDALVVLPAPFGQRCDPAAADTIRAAGCRLLEDRTTAPLSELELVGDHAVTSLYPWLPVPDGALLLSAKPLPEPFWLPAPLALVGDRVERAAGELEDGADHELAFQRSYVAGEIEDPDAGRMSRWTERALRDGTVLAGLRSSADQLARELMHRLGESCPFTHWPIGTHAHGFPVLLADRTASERLLRAGARAWRPWIGGTREGVDLAERLLVVTDGDPDRIARALNRAEIGAPA